MVLQKRFVQIVDKLLEKVKVKHTSPVVNRRCFNLCHFYCNSYFTVTLNTKWLEIDWAANSLRAKLIEADQSFLLSLFAFKNHLTKSRINKNKSKREKSVRKEQEDKNINRYFDEYFFIKKLVTSMPK